jgi:hypothetical protein
MQAPVPDADAQPAPQAPDGSGGSVALSFGVSGYQEVPRAVNAWLAAPADAAATAALRACLDAQGGEQRGWCFYGANAFAALSGNGPAAEAPGAPRLLVRVLRAAVDEVLPRQPCGSVIQLRRGLTVQTLLHGMDAEAWVVAMLATVGAAADRAVRERRAAAAQLMWVYPPHRHAAVAAAAAAALASAAARGETDDAALSALAAFSQEAEVDGALLAAAAAAACAVPGCFEALAALARGAGGAGGATLRRQRHALSALTQVAANAPDAWSALLLAGALDAAVAALRSERADVCRAAVLLLRHLASGGDGDTWGRLCAAGALPAVLSCHALRPGSHAFAAEAARFLLHCAVAWQDAQAASAGALPVPPAGMPGAARAAFHRRAAHCVDGGVDMVDMRNEIFWDAALTLVTSSPRALAALADAKAAHADEVAHGVLLPAAQDCSKAAFVTLARAALSDDAWPVAALLRAAAAAQPSFDELTQQHPSTAAHGARAHMDAALFEALQVWGDDACATLLAVQGGLVTSAVSCALLAPRLPHLGALLATHAPQRAPLLIDALLAVAATLRAAAAASHSLDIAPPARRYDDGDDDEDAAADADATARERAAAR